MSGADGSHCGLTGGFHRKSDSMKKVLAAFSILLLIAIACIVLLPSKRPDFLFIVVDCWRYDHFTHAITPNLWKLSKKGTTFGNHYVNAGWTLPSMISTFSGQLPEFSSNDDAIKFNGFARFGTDFIHLFNKEFETFPKALPTFPEILQKNGYETIAVTMNSLTSEKIGYGSKQWSKMTYLRKDHGAEILTNETIKQLRARTSEKELLLFVHYLDAHWPYDPVHKTPQDNKYLSEYKKTEDSARRLELVQHVLPLHTNAIRFIDEQIGRLLEEIDQSNLIIIITSDHGEMFMEEGHIFHPGHLPEEIVHVPLLIVGDGLPRNQQIELTQSLDIAPTILSMAGVESSELDSPGKDVFSETRNPNLVIATSTIETAYMNGGSVKRVPFQPSVTNAQFAEELKALGYLN